MVDNAQKPAGLLTLEEISRHTGISYPTLQRYLERYGTKIPSVGSGTDRRYPPAAIEVFKKLHRD